MAAGNIVPEKINSPIQLVAAWFTMLVITVAALLTTATQISSPDWAPGFLIIVAACVIAFVLIFVALMLTLFRPHLQEGKEYSEWLKDQNAYVFIKEETPPITKSFTRKKETSKHQKISYKKTSSTPSRKEETLYDLSFSELDKDDVNVSVINAVGAEKIISKLRQSGFNASLYLKELEDYGQIESIKNLQEAIWIGNNVPPKIAVPIISQAVNIWPDLKFLHLSRDGNVIPPDYVHDQIFLGGSSSTAKEYKLQQWSGSEISKLTTDMSFSEFHDAIRKKYN